MQEMTRPMRQPVRIAGSAAGNTTVNSAGAAKPPPPAPTTPAWVRRGGALIGRQQDRKDGIGNDQGHLGGMLEAEDQNERGVECDFRHRRQHAHERPQQPSTLRLPAAATPSVTPTTTAMPNPANRRNRVVAACPRIPGATVRRGARTLPTGAATVPQVPCRDWRCRATRRYSAGGSMPSTISPCALGVHDAVPTAMSWPGSAQATSLARKRSNSRSRTKPSTPMMTIMA